MSVFQSGNPAMQVLDRWEDRMDISGVKPRVMTIGGTVTATGILLAIVSVVGILVWQKLNASYIAGTALPGWTLPALIVSGFSGILVSFILSAKPKAAPVLAPLHAVLEGAFVGALSFYIPARFLSDTALAAGAGNTLVLQAVLATFAICAAMLLGYGTGVLRLGGFARKLITTMGIGLCVYVVALMLLGMFGIRIWNGFADAGPIGIGFTAFCLALASLYLLLDFQFIEEGVKSGAPKYMEWVGAWGLMVTLVWVYIEVLRLLSKLRSSD